MPSPEPILTVTEDVSGTGVTSLTDMHPAIEVGTHHCATGDAVGQVHAPFDGLGCYRRINGRNNLYTVVMGVVAFQVPDWVR